MPIIVPPAISAIPQGHRVAAHFQFNGNDTIQKRPIMGTTIVEPTFWFDISMSQVQGAAQIKRIRSVQMSYVIYPHTATNFPLVGLLYVVVDGLQVFTFEIPENPIDVIGFMPMAFNVIFPIIANAQSTVSFALFIGNYNTGANAEIGELYVNLADFDMPPFSYRSQGIFQLT